MYYQQILKRNVLSFKINVGQFQHWADLVTKINYHNFYMSDTGNLITAPTTSPLMLSWLRPCQCEDEIANEYPIVFI